MMNCMCTKVVAKNIKLPYFYMDCHILDHKTTLWAKFQFQLLYIVVKTKVHHIHIKQRWQVSLLQKFRIMQIFVWQTFQSARPQYQRGQAGLHFNSCYTANFYPLKTRYRISANSFCGKYSFLEVVLRQVFKGGNYSFF